MSGSNLASGDAPQRILLTRLRFIGDVVLTTPVIRALRKAYPKAHIAYLAEPEPAQVLLENPHLDQILILDRQRWAALPPIRRLYYHLRFLVALRQQHFDWVIDLFCNPRSALLTVCSGASRRVGFPVRGRGVVYNRKIRPGPSRRASDIHLDALRTLQVPHDGPQTEIFLSDSERDWARAWLTGQGISREHRLIGLNPGASWPAKRWPVERFAALADELVRCLDARPLIFWGPGQKSIMAAMQGRMCRPAWLTPPLTLRQLAALLACCDLLISNDGAPLHMAVALGTRTVGIFGASQPDIWFPYPAQEGHLVVQRKPDCHPCFQDFCPRTDEPMICMRAITVDAVLEAVQTSLQVENDRVTW